MSSKLVKAVAGSLLVFIIAFTGLTYNSNDYDSSAIVSNYKKTLAPSRTNTVQTLSEAISNSESQVASTPPPNSGIGHNHVYWNQNDYSDIISSTTSIADGGCGWCSLTSMMAYFCPNECASRKPPDWFDEMGSSVRAYWSGGSMDWGAPQAWISQINTLGKYGQYTMLESVTGRSDQSVAILKMIKKYAGDPNTVVVLSTSTGLFTGGGHIIIAVDLTDDGEYFHLCNSSGRAAANMGITWDESNQYDYPFNVTSLNGHPYFMKCAWVIQRTDTAGS